MKMINRGVFTWVLVAAVVATFFGCLSSERAIKKLSKHGDLAKVCSDSFPVRRSTDTVYVEVEDTAAVNALEGLNAGLRKRIEYLEGLPPVIDSTACQKLRAAYISDMIRYEREISRLKDSLKVGKVKIIRITNTEVDSAALQALRLEKDKKIVDLEKELDFMTKDRDKMDAKAGFRGKVMWIAIGLSVVLLVLVGFVLGKKIKPSIFK